MMRLAELYAPPIKPKSQESAHNIGVNPMVGDGAAAKSGTFAMLEKDADKALQYYKLAAVCFSHARKICSTLSGWRCDFPCTQDFRMRNGFCKVDVSWG
jgi:hypothetical protein